jgi:hypothetical protein
MMVIIRVHKARTGSAAKQQVRSMARFHRGRGEEIATEGAVKWVLSHTVCIKPSVQILGDFTIFLLLNFKVFL